MKTIKLLAYTNNEELDTVVIVPKDEQGNELQGVLMQLAEQPQSVQDKAEQVRIIYSQILANAGKEDTSILYSFYKDRSEEFGNDKNTITVQNNSKESVNTGDLLIWGETHVAEKQTIDEFATICTIYINTTIN